MAIEACIFITWGIFLFQKNFFIQDVCIKGMVIFQESGIYWKIYSRYHTYTIFITCVIIAIIFKASECQITLR